MVLHPGRLNYSVTVRNHTGRAVRLNPCPGYTESAAAWKDPATPHPAMIRRRYYLNCAAVRAIPPNDSITYADASARCRWAVSDLVKFGWFMDGRGGRAPG